MPERKFLNRQSVAWAVYDVGNSAFALSVLAVLFPLFLGVYWSAGDAGTGSNLAPYLGNPQSQAQSSA